MYHRKHWLDSKGNSMPALCFIFKVKITNATDTNIQKYKTRKELKQIASDREDITEDELDNMKELRPPELMPNGNVGTPTTVFLEFINQCKLPPVIIKKLGLVFPKTRSNKKYGNVPFDYGNEVAQSLGEEEIVVRSRSGHELETVHVTVNESNEEGTDNTIKKSTHDDIETHESQKECEESDEEDDGGEEWDRHEALHDDPANVERNKERLFEEEIELKWEKGGSGLVFYTDAQYWDAKEGDFDERTADDWDVDMSAYYEKGAGDKDIRDYLTIRKETMRRNGIDVDSDEDDTPPTSVGKFEKHTKGIGRRVLEKQGWKDGMGMGRKVQGMTIALDNDGQQPSDKTGFGYHGEKLLRYGRGKRPKRMVSHTIGTIYDNPEDLDPAPVLLRRKEPHSITWRSDYNFVQGETINKKS